MEPSMNHYYDHSKRLLTMVGQWPYQKPKEKLFFTAVIIVSDISIMVTQVAQYFVCESTQCIFQTLPPHMLAMMILVKVLTYYFNSQKIKNLTDHLFLDWNVLESQEERDIMKRYAENGRWYTLVYASYVYVSTLSFTTTPLLPRILDVVLPLNHTRPVMLICPAYYFVDEEQYFYYIFSHTLICATICLTGLIAHDCMFFTYVEHVCGLFAVVGFRFEHLLYKRNNMKENLINSSDNVYHKNVVVSIYAHWKALQFATLLENIFSVSFAVQILIVTVGMSITLIQITAQLHNDLPEVMRYFVFAVAQLFHLFCLSFQGQKLINHSLETREKIYNGLWYEIPAKSQKMLLFVMRKSMDASFLTAGKIYVFSLENFTTVVQTSMSYFTVLSSFNE